MIKLSCFLAILTIFCSCSSADRSIQTIAWIGCNRRGSDWDKDKSPTRKPSGANINQLTQTIQDLNQLQIPAEEKAFFFMTGDLVPGLKTPSELTIELEAWTKLYRSLSLSSQYNFVPLTGNHESLTETNGIETLNPDAVPVWLNWITSSQFDQYAGNGPTNGPPNLDNLTSDQSKFSYSFDHGSIHYVVLNTDTVTKANKIGFLPLNWLTTDIQNAQKNSAIQTILIFGHKPIVPAKPPLGMNVKGSDLTIDPSLVQPMTDLFDQNPKVKAYLCAHAHLWDAQRLPGKRGVWQVISGFGGSPLDYNGNPASGSVFGFTVLKVYESGNLSVTEYSRPVPNPYTGATTAATPKTEFMISY